MSWARDISNLIKRMVERALSDVHTHLPAVVVSYDATMNTAKVQPCVNRIRSEDPNNMTSVELPVLEDVPVRQFGSGKCLLTVAPQVGSYGLLHISERTLETWLLKGGVVDPNSTRKFDLSDAIFEPGLYPLVVDGNNGQITPAIKTDRIELRTRLGTCYIAVLDNGVVEIDGVTTIKIGGSSASEAAMQGDKFLTKYNGHTHTTAFGPSGTPVVPWTTADNSLKVKIG